MKRLTFLLVASIFLFTSCSQNNFRVISEGEKNLPQISTVAILPFEVYIYGQIDKEMTDEMLLEFENKVSVTYQANIYKNILKKENSEGEDIYVKLQDYKLTNKILNENNISIRDSWEYNPDYLANMLNVDAVLIARVEKEQKKSDNFSAFMELLQVLAVVFETDTLDPELSNNKEILLDYALVDSKGLVIWADGKTIPYKWRNKTEKVMDKAMLNSAECFPYFCSSNSARISN